MQTRIAAALATLEATHGVRMLYACESGSRAWGFPSPDSDYDVRFIYCHPAAWYLRLDEGPGTLNFPVDADYNLRAAAATPRAGARSQKRARPCIN